SWSCCSNLLHLRAVRPLPVAVQDSAPALSNSAPATTAAVEVAGLTRQFESAVALSGVTLSIRQGEFISLLGPSGCGKTTLLRIVAGLDDPDGGRVQIAGADARDIPAHRRPVNTVFQSYALFPHLNVFD